MHRVDQRHHAVEPEAEAEIGVARQQGQDRRRIGEPGRFDDDAADLGDAAIVEAAQQVLESDDQVAAHRAADAAGGQRDDVVLGPLDEKMVEADLAELVDDHRGLGEGVVLEETVEERRLAGA